MNASLFYCLLLFCFFFFFLQVNIYGYLVIFQWTLCNLSCLNLSVMQCLLLLFSSRVFIYHGQISNKISLCSFLYEDILGSQTVPHSLYWDKWKRTWACLSSPRWCMILQRTGLGSTTAASGLCHRKAEGLKEPLIPEPLKNLDAFGKKEQIF